MRVPNGKMYIDGEWKNGESSFVSINPFNNAVIGHVEKAQDHDVLDAIKSAEKAYIQWKLTSVYERAKILLEIARRIEHEKEYLANIMVVETGKPIGDARIEVATSIGNFEWYAGEIVKQNDEIVHAHDTRIQVVNHTSLGVVAIISPWNFPLNLITRKLAPALAAGNSVVLKPSSESPLVASALLEVINFDTLPVPKGLVNLVNGDSTMISEVIMRENSVRKLTFTGSTRVGKLLYSKSAQSLKKISLELGGNSPYIVTNKANIEKAAQDIVLVKTRNNGQICVAPNRVFVQSDVYDLFVAQVIKFAKTIKFGDPADKEVRYGPLINKNAVNSVRTLIKDAISKNAKCVYEESIMFDGKNAVPLTVLSKVNEEMRIYHEEIFGPVIALVPFESIEEVIERSNATEYGLACYIYSTDLSEISELTTHIDSGLFAVNNTVVSTVETPFGGVKHSGIGLENGKYGLKEFQNVRLISFKAV